MRNMLRTIGVLASLAMLLFVIAGCSSGPNENELKLLEETKAAALAAESAQAECASEKAKLEGDLAAAKQKLQEMKQEKADVQKRLSAM